MKQHDCRIPFFPTIWIILFPLYLFGQSDYLDNNRVIDDFLQTAPILDPSLQAGQGGIGIVLLIGIDSSNAEWKFPNLKAPQCESSKLKAIFERNNFKVKTLTGRSASAGNIYRWLIRLSTQLRLADKLIVYYAGHACGLMEMSSCIDTASLNRFFPRIRALAEAKKKHDDLCLILRQNDPRVIGQFLLVDSMITVINRGAEQQKIFIIDACFGGSVVNMFHIPVDLMSKRVMNDGFFMLTSALRPVEDGLTGKYFIRALNGEADDTLAGNHDGFVSLYEATVFTDSHINHIRDSIYLEPYKSRYLFAGSGQVILSKKEIP
jgi:hypothetical protein